MTGALVPAWPETVTDRIKYDVCAEFIVYKRENSLNQRELAQKLEISEALVSKILRYQFTEFTIDRRRSYLEKLGIKYEFTHTTAKKSGSGLDMTVLPHSL